MLRAHLPDPDHAGLIELLNALTDSMTAQAMPPAAEGRL